MMVIYDFHVLVLRIGMNENDCHSFFRATLPAALNGLACSADQVHCVYKLIIFV